MNTAAKVPGTPGGTASSPWELRRRQLLALAAALPLGAGALTACGSAAGTPLTSDVEREEVPLSEVEELLPKALAASDALSAAALASYLTSTPGGNALVSPLSLSLVLALLAPGATDPAAQGFDSILGVSGEDRNRVWSAIQSSVNRNDGDPEGFDPEDLPEEPLVHLANHVAIQEGFTVEQAYLDTALRWLSAQIEQVPLDDLKKNLDTWAKEQTGGLIPSSGVQPTEDTALVLQNALLFAAKWASPFDAEDTLPGPFTRADGSTVETDLMHDTKHLLYVSSETDGKYWEAVRLDYQGGQSQAGAGLALDVILPARGTLPSDLDPGTWAVASAALDEASQESQETDVKLALPKLDLKSSPHGLLALLVDQGLDPTRFAGIAPNLALNDVVQQVRLIMDEEGTVAAALSEISVETSAAPPPASVPFIVDHPYALRLRDLDSGATLLEAAIMDPTATES